MFRSSTRRHRLRRELKNTHTNDTLSTRSIRFVCRQLNSREPRVVYACATARGEEEKLQQDCIDCTTRT